MYWFGAIILVILNGLSAASNLLMLPGNWFMVGALSLFLVVFGDATGGPDWITLIVVVGLAGLGELLEVFAGGFTASRKQASRRALVLSLVLSFAGSIGGTFMVPIPLIGSAIGAILGAALGSFAGAYVGEASLGADSARSKEIGTAAMTGRLLGMLAKVGIGAAIFVIQLVSLWR